MSNPRIVPPGVLNVAVTGLINERSLTPNHWLANMPPYRITVEEHGRTALILDEGYTGGSIDLVHLAGTILHASMPMIREQIAREIETERDRIETAQVEHHGYLPLITTHLTAGYTQAARIVRGEA